MDHIYAPINLEVGKVSSWIKHKIKDNLTHSTDRKQARNPKLTASIAGLHTRQHVLLILKLEILAEQVDVCRSQGAKGCLVCVFKRSFLVFKLYFKYFNIFFHPQVFS